MKFEIALVVATALAVLLVSLAWRRRHQDHTFDGYVARLRDILHESYVDEVCQCRRPNRVESEEWSHSETGCFPMREVL